MYRFLILGLALIAAAASAQPASFDIIIRNGTVIDGSGNPRFDADVGIRHGFIAAVGDLGQATATTQIDARGLFVTPGFINIHSHASADALPTAVNMLTQGVTTEILNADGGGPLDLAQQLHTLAVPGLAVNVGGYIGFNSAWASVVGNADRRASAEEIQRMRGTIATGLSQGAWGVSAGLDYKPAYFARTEEVIKIVEVARPARTNFTSHDRVTPESNFSSKAGITETLVIGQKSGLVPVVTHMKITGAEKGSAGAVLASMAQAAQRGSYVAADAYPYLAGQSGLGSLIIPGWAQEGGREAMVKRFADPKLRALIITEAEHAMQARFGGPESVYLPRTQQQLTAVMKEMNAGAGETVLRILEQGDPGAILHFGIEEDLVRILSDPATSMACDCGASTATRVHPRFYGSFPRVLGRYVREQKIMTWEQAIRKSTSLPAATIGMIDRGLVSPGMAADLTVFDPNTVIDHATYDHPAERSQGIRFVLVNGTVALEDGVPTQAHSGKPLYRTVNMPSRPTNETLRSLSAKGTVSGHRVSINLAHRAGARQAAGAFDIDGFGPVETIGVLQTTSGWASVTGVDRARRSVALVVDLHDPGNPGSATFAVNVDGAPAMRGSLPLNAVTITTAVASR
jgi:N-acyl-D-aspartate/D-glutamate deacylase